MHISDPIILTIVGITGDLSKRYLLPSLYHLEFDNLLPEDFMILGTSRRDIDREQFKQTIREKIIKMDNNCDDSVLDRLLSRLELAKINMSDSDHSQPLAEKLKSMEESASRCTEHVFYLAIPPEALGNVIDIVGQSEVHKCLHGKLGRLLIEKPFGSNEKSAKNLSKILFTHFEEEQIYRIDHYLAKETAQNILHFRFKNPLVHDLWNSKFIDHIQITAAENIGIEGRVDFYEQTGAVKDFLQSHLLQLLALTTMEEPKELDAEHVRAAREKVLSEIKPIKDINKQVVRGQYQGYQDEVGQPHSNTETYVALQLEIDNDHWRGVPIYMRTGKSMARRITEINLVYRNDEINSEKSNVITIRIQPREGISISLQAKKPGLDSVRQDIDLEYCYSDDEDSKIHNAYERLLLDAMRGDQMLFPTTDEVLTSWRLVDPIIEAWAGNNDNLEVYKVGSWGPKAANQLVSHNSQAGWLTQGDKICID